MILNAKNVADEQELVSKLAQEIETDVFHYVLRDGMIQLAENDGKTVIEYDHTHVFDKLDAELVGVPKTANKLPNRYVGIEEVGMTTEASYIGDLVSRVGAENIATKLAEDPTAGYIQFSLEQIMEQNPDYILRFAHGNIEETKKSFDHSLMKIQLGQH